MYTYTNTRNYKPRKKLLPGQSLPFNPKVSHWRFSLCSFPDLGTTRDLYCVLECDRIHKARTVVRTGDLVFDWDETFELDLVGNKELDFLIYSWDPQYRHKLCYKVSLLLHSSPASFSFLLLLYWAVHRIVAEEKKCVGTRYIFTV